MKKIQMPNGKEYSFAPATFTPEVVRCVELFEEIGGSKDFKSYGELLRNLHSVLISCLTRGGHTQKEALDAVGSIPLGKEMAPHLDTIRAAIGLD